MTSGDSADIGALYDSLDSFLPVYFGFINPVIHQLDTGSGILNENQIKVLMAVWKTGGVSQAEISRIFMIPKTSLTTVVRSLEKRGLLIRRGQDDDRRRYELRLSAAGHALLERKREANIADLSKLFAGLSIEEGEAVSAGFRAMVRFFRRKGFAV